MATCLGLEGLVGVDDQGAGGVREPEVLRVGKDRPARAEAAAAAAAADLVGANHRLKAMVLEEGAVRARPEQVPCAPVTGCVICMRRPLLTPRLPHTQNAADRQRPGSSAGTPRVDRSCPSFPPCQQ